MFEGLFVLVVDLGTNLEKIRNVTIESTTVHTIVFDCFKIDVEDLYAVDEFLCSATSRATMPNLKKIKFRGLKACLASGFEWEFVRIEPTLQIEIQKLCRCVN